MKTVLRLTVTLAGVLCLATVVAFAAQQDAAPPRTCYVAPGGDDSHPGTKARPFATIERAREHVRTLRKGAAGPIHVILRGGYHFLERPIEFAAADSGTPTAPIVYRACQDERPIISGGFRLSLQWRPYRDGIMAADVPQADVSLPAGDRLADLGVEVPVVYAPCVDLHQGSDPFRPLLRPNMLDAEDVQHLLVQVDAPEALSGPPQRLDSVDTQRAQYLL